MTPMTIQKRTRIAALMAGIALAACSPQAENETTADDAAAEMESPETADYEHVAFTKEAFEAAKADGKPILVDVFAPWCPTCKQQQAGIAIAANDPKNEGLVVFRLDYDTQADNNRDLRITRQSTLIAFKGKEETGRGIAVTTPMEIGKIVATTR